jgi:transcriptional regulator with XRE-family HTH domain
VRKEDLVTVGIAGAGLRERRARLELSQAALAARLGRRQATISDWETEKDAPDSPQMLDLALRALEYEADIRAVSRADRKQQRKRKGVIL